ncbi:MAG: hypothetical protein ACRD0S_01325 [Acidimicrobiales bacterium]
MAHPVHLHGLAQTVVAKHGFPVPQRFLSTQFVPEPLLPHWVQVASDWNPFTYMIDAARALISGPLTLAPIVKAVLVSLAVLVITQVAARRAFAKAVDAA